MMAKYGKKNEQDMGQKGAGASAAAMGAGAVKPKKKKSANPEGLGRALRRGDDIMKIIGDD
jgi:hypothetical protein